ncbi:hypothetical protein [Acidipila sp. EB88]|uniref:hypothetical protein n=1 Tax=Acidipila sp. EB88 TaxID=2305226 RepID=UPI000F5E3FF6|nr:hypothetical protein [Acidipila sp. EB88]RRA48137.1 hypothetical protein D1Y84_07380 [Acidipila sp. EB88]
MKEPTAFSLSKLVSSLVGREVAFALVPKLDKPAAKPIYGTYAEVPGNQTLVVRAELAMLGTLAGYLVGLPEDTAIERASSRPMDETLRDAIHELLNIFASGLSTEHRVIFRSMTDDLLLCSGEALDVIRKPERQSNYRISADGKAKGTLSILSCY